MTNRLRFTILLAGCIILSQVALAQVSLECDTSCGGSSSTTTSSMISARNSKAATRRGGTARRVGGATAAVQGSRSFVYDVPLFSLPGRGLNLNLTLHYNSSIWTIAGPFINLNTDRDTPSYGFRLDFGFIEFSGDQTSGVLMEANGIKHPLARSPSQPNPGILFQTTDSSYIQVQYTNSSSPVVATYKSGIRVFYQGFPQPLEYRPYQIEDTNGNIIQIFYLNSTNLLLSAVTDTVGRTIHFYYDSTQTMLSCVTAAANCSTPIVPTFTFQWNPAYILNFAFVRNTGTTLKSGVTQLNVLTGVTRPDGTRVSFSYGDWAIVNQVQELSTTGAVRYSTN